MDNPAVRDRASKRIVYELFHDDLIPPELPEEPDLELTPSLARATAFARAYLNLHTAIDVVGQCAIYFRRFPFRHGEVEKADHLRNMCEMYLSAIYVLRSRFKTALNSYNETTTGRHIAVGEALKNFDREFDQPLRARNAFTHHLPFEDLALGKLRLAGLLSKGASQYAWLKGEHERSYRKASKAWSERAERSASTAKRILEAFSERIVCERDALGL